MKIEKLAEDKKLNTIQLRISGSNEVFINSLRRLIIEEVPTLAVEIVEVKDNNSALYDEMLALRLGLIPIKTDLKSYQFAQNEDEIKEKSARSTLQIKLKSSKKGVVLAGEAQSADPKCTFVYEDMPVVKLLAKQKLDVTMTAILGKGREHTKWSPGWAFYNKEPKITLGKVQDPAAIAAASSDKVFTLKGNKLQIDQGQANNSQLLHYYEELDNQIKVEYTDNYIFNLESWGQLSCKEILVTAAQILTEKTDELLAQL